MLIVCKIETFLPVDPLCVFTLSYNLMSVDRPGVLISCADTFKGMFQLK